MDKQDIKPKIRTPKIYSQAYYYARKLYFEAKLLPTNDVDHTYTSEQISNIVAKEFNTHIPSSTIRRWVASQDKDFDNRTWLQEWERLIAVGVVKSAEQSPNPEQMFGTPQPDDNKPETPMQKLAQMKERTLNVAMSVTQNIDSLIMLMLKEIGEKLSNNGRKITPEIQGKIEFLTPFFKDARALVIKESENAPELEKKLDSEELYGNLVQLKDPQSRERVRSAIVSIIKQAVTTRNAKGE